MATLVSPVREGALYLSLRRRMLATLSLLKEEGRRKTISASLKEGGGWPLLSFSREGEKGGHPSLARSGEGGHVCIS